MVRRTAKMIKAHIKTYGAIASILALVSLGILLRTSFSSWWADLLVFSKAHPAIVVVLMGVFGEGGGILLKIFNKEFHGRHEHGIEIFEALCWMTVVIGLALEIPEASKADERASSNEVHVASLSNETVRLNIQLAEAQSNAERIRQEVEPISSVTADLKIKLELYRTSSGSMREITTPISENEDLSSATLDVSLKDSNALPLHFVVVKSKFFQLVPMESQYNNVLVSFDLDRAYSTRISGSWMQSDDIFEKPAELIGLVDVVKVNHLFPRPLKGVAAGTLTLRFNSLPRTFPIRGAFSNDFALTGLAVTNASEIIKELAK
jgi:hypothetical protein